jgi:ubiquitin-protein ligase
MSHLNYFLSLHEIAMATARSNEKEASADAKQRLARVLASQYHRCVSDADGNPNLLAIIDEADMRSWYYLIVGLSEPYQGGEYIFKLTAPTDFPFSPPAPNFLTPNGVYATNASICVDIGVYHSSGWRTGLGMQGFSVNLVNGMICHEELRGGMGILAPPKKAADRQAVDAWKQKLAAASRAFNAARYPAVSRAFDAIIAGETPFSPPAVAAARQARGMALVKPPATPPARETFETCVLRYLRECPGQDFGKFLCNEYLGRRNGGRVRHDA